ncbi:hypothetical protein [Maricaulis sp.]|uniref:hypothetical protein n=1 Tax=Maricaulis sp. TaxID=1486257 RepID=UPI003A91F8C9
MRALVWALLAGLALANAVAAQDLSASDSRSLIEWVSQRNSVQQRMVVVTLRIRSAVVELASIPESDVGLDEWHREIDRALERLGAAGDDIDRAVSDLPPPPIFDGRGGLNDRLEASFNGVLLLQSRSSALLMQATDQLEALRASDEISVYGLDVLDIDAQIALVDAVIAQKEAMRSSDLSHPGTLENIASTALNRVSRDMLELLRMLVASERSPGLEEELLLRIESDAGDVRDNIEPIRRAVVARLDDHDRGLAAEGPEAVARYGDLMARLATILETHTAVAEHYSSLDGAVTRFVGAYRAALDDRTRGQVVSDLADEINRIAVRANEIQANRLQLSTELARAYETL